MHRSKIYQQPCLNSHAFSFSFINSLIFKKHTREPTRRPAIIQDFQKKHPAIQKSFSSLPQGKSRDEKTLIDEARHHHGLTEDPLWKHVCADAVNLMGPMALAISQVQLGEVSSKDKTVDIYCQTEEISHFLLKYHFIILGSLQKYFPNLKEITVQIRS